MTAILQNLTSNKKFKVRKHENLGNSEKRVDGMNNVEFHCNEDNPAGILQLASLLVHARLYPLYPMLVIIFHWLWFSFVYFLYHSPKMQHLRSNQSAWLMCWLPGLSLSVPNVPSGLADQFWGRQK